MDFTPMLFILQTVSRLLSELQLANIFAMSNMHMSNCLIQHNSVHSSWIFISFHSVSTKTWTTRLLLYCFSNLLWICYGRMWTMLLLRLDMELKMVYLIGWSRTLGEKSGVTMATLRWSWGKTCVVSFFLIFVCLN